jgi:hypothetical protein
MLKSNIYNIMIYKGYTSSPLHILKSNNKWEIVDLKSKYKDTYMQIKNVLDNLQNKRKYC